MVGHDKWCDGLELWDPDCSADRCHMCRRAFEAGARLALNSEIEWLENVASYPKQIGEKFHVAIILKHLEALRKIQNANN